MADYREDKMGGQENGGERNISCLFDSPISDKNLELPSACILSFPPAQHPPVICRLMEKGHRQHLINQSEL